MGALLLWGTWSDLKFVGDSNMDKGVSHSHVDVEMGFGSECSRKNPCDVFNAKRVFLS